MPLIIRSPIDTDRLTAAIGDTRQLQFDEPLTESEYRLVARLLENHPRVTLRAYGLDTELAGLEFLRFFPKLRRFSISHLHHVTDVAPLNALPDDLQLLDLGVTAEPLDLGSLKFTRLRDLLVSGHTDGLSQLVSNNPELESLSLSRLRADSILDDAQLPAGLERLFLVLGSASDLWGLRRLPDLRQLALRQVKGVNDTTLAVVGELPRLQWLWLDTLPGVTRVPQLFRDGELQRLDLDGLSGMRGDDALAAIADATKLREASLTSCKLAVSAFSALAGHPTLSAITIGLGGVRKNQQAQALLNLPAAMSVTEYARRHSR